MKKSKILLTSLFAIVFSLFLVACEMEMPVHEHSMVAHEAVEATCTVEGNVHYYECVRCERLYADALGETLIKLADTVVPAKGHDTVKVPHVESTCVEEGHIEYYTCKGCDEIFAEEEALTSIGIASTYLPLAPHTSVVVDMVAPTCTKAGVKAHYRCSFCEQHFEDAECNYVMEESAYTIAALGHSMTKHDAVAPTCTEKGTHEYYTCSGCSKVFKDVEGATETTVVAEEIASTGHSMTKHDAVAPTCTEKGTHEYYTCSACSKVFKDVEGAEETAVVAEEIASTGHSMTKHDAVAPTCTEKGTHEYYTCSGCSKVFKDVEGATETTVAAEEIAALGHKMTKHDAVSSTCTTTGSNEYYTCSACSKVFKDVEGATETTVAAEVTPLARHTMVEHVATYDASGVSHVRYYECSVCLQLFENYAGTTPTTLEEVTRYATQINGDCLATPGYTVEFGSSYKFVEGETGVYTSNNKGVNSSEATMKINVLRDGLLVLNYSVSSEASYDKLIITSSDYTFSDIEYSGNKTGSNLIVEVKAGYTYTIKYQKDGSSSSGTDTAIVSNIRFVDTEVYEKATVTFQPNNGSASMDVEVYVGTKVTAPANLTNGNKYFAGWFTADDVEFDLDTLVTSDIVLSAKWTDPVTVSYSFNGEVVASELIAVNSAYTASKPAEITAIIDGFYTDIECSVPYVDGTVISVDTTIYVKEKSFAPAGVLTSFENVISGKECGYVYDDVTNTFTSNNYHVSSGIATLKLTFAKKSFVTFDFVVCGEKNYDYFFVKVNGTEVYTTKSLITSGTDYSGAFAMTLEAGDVLELIYKKDGSGDKGSDRTAISNLVIRDGVPALSITVDYNNDQANEEIQAEINSEILTNADLVAKTPADTDTVRFGGWFYDEACTTPVLEGDTLIESITVYARYLYPVVVSFDTDGAGVIDPISVWTNTPITMPANPTKAHYIFRHWLDEFGNEFDPAKGVSEATTLTAYFELLPVGSTKEEAVVMEMTGTTYTYRATTNSEFMTFYTKFVPTATDLYIFEFENENISLNPNSSVSNNYYRRYSIETADGTVVVSETNSMKEVVLTAGETYYIKHSLCYGSYKGWGSFDVIVHNFEHNNAAEAIPYEFGTVYSIPTGTFVHGNEKLVYSFTPSTTGSYKFEATCNIWAGFYIYKDAQLKSAVLSNKNASYGNVVSNVDLVAGTTYYVVVSNNWKNEEFTIGAISFSIVEYADGYTPTTPQAYTVGQTQAIPFDGGFTAYFTTVVSEAGTYKLVVSNLADSKTKKVEIYTDATYETKVVEFQTSTEDVLYIDTVPAGTYYVKAFNTAANSTKSFSIALEKVETGAYWTVPTELTLASSMEVTPSADLGHFYSFTTGDASLWHLFSVSEGTTVELYDSTKTKLDASASKLAANTTYFLVVKGEAATATVTYTTAESIQNGLTPESAWVYSADMVIPTEKSSTYYIVFTPTESGKYRFYSNNNTNLDTKGFLDTDATKIVNASSSSNCLKYNDDGKNIPNAQGYIGYQYDFYFDYDLEAGTTYYLKVKFSISGSTNTEGLVCRVSIQKMA